MLYLLLTGLLQGGAATYPTCQGVLARHPALVPIATSMSAAELARAASAMSRSDAIQRLARASRAWELSPGAKADRELIGALPASESAARELYALTEPDCVIPGWLKALGGGSWVEPALTAIQRRRRGVRPFLIAAWAYGSNAEVSESFADSVAQLRDALPEEFSRAVSSLDEGARGHIRMLLEYSAQ